MIHRFLPAAAIMIAVCSSFYFNCINPSDASEKPSKNDVAGETIGPEGGTIVTDSASLFIPPGALASSVVISITKITPDSSLSGEAASPTYRIKGLPGSLSETIRMVIIPDAEVTDGVPVVAVTESLYIPSRADTLPSTSLVAARDSAGAIVVDLVPDRAGGLVKRTYTAASGGGSHAIDITVVAGYSAYDTDHFRIRYRTSMASETNVEEFGDAFERIYHYFEDTLNMPVTRYTRWPFEIIIRNMADEGAFSPAGIFSAAYIEIRTDLVESNKPVSVTTAAHEFLHFMQALNHRLGGNDEWFDEASAVYVEGLFAPSPSSYQSDVWKTYAMQPFRGLRAGVDSADASDTWIGRGAIRARRHGYGMSAVIQYLMNRFGSGNGGIHRLRLVFDAIRTSPTDPLSRLGYEFDLPGMWIQNFFERYVTGNVYGQFMPVFHDKWEVRSAADTGIDYASHYADLSTKIYEITLTNIDSAAGFTFSSKGGASLYRELSVIRLGGGGVNEVWGRASGDSVLTLPARDLTRIRAQKLRVMLSYAENSLVSRGADLTLKIRYGMEPQAVIVSPLLIPGERAALHTLYNFTARVAGIAPGKQLTYYWNINDWDTTITKSNDSTASFYFPDGGAIPIHLEIQDPDRYDLTICEADTACTVSVINDCAQTIVGAFSLQAPMMLSVNGSDDAYFYEVYSDNNREGIALTWSGAAFGADAHIGGETGDGYEYTVKINGIASDDGLMIKVLNWNWEKISYSINSLTNEKYMSKKETCRLTASNIPFFRAKLDTIQVSYAINSDSLLKADIGSLHSTLDQWDADGNNYNSEVVTGLNPDETSWSSNPNIFVLMFTKPSK